MRKLLLSVVALAAIVFGANALTNMCVEQEDGTIVRYDVEKVKQVYYEEIASADTAKSDTTGTYAQGVTVSGQVGNYTYVDLGLESGTKWATYNVGATQPTEYGDYFAWGETSTKEKEDYSWKTYKWCNGSYNTLTKYCVDSQFGTVDSLTTLLAEDDAATANWGEGWRMPTFAELKELLDGCDWKWTTDFNGSGVLGRIGTSKANGNTIFLPAAGYRDGTLLGTGGYGGYWSSSLNENGSYNAYYLYFHLFSIGWGNYYRHCGQRVRAIVREIDSAEIDTTKTDTITTDSTKIDSLITDTTKIDSLTTDSTKIDSLITDSTKIDSLITDTTKIDSLITDSTKIDSLITDTTKIDSLITDTTKIDSLITDTTKIDSLITDSTKIDSLITDTTKIDSLTTDTTKIDSLTTDSTKIDSLITDSTKIDSLTTDTTKIDSLTTDTTKIDTIKTDTTGTYAQGVTVSGKVGNYTYVDLGLESGTKWATYNVGATQPTEYGDYFAWGEITEKEDYSWKTYKWCNGSYNTLTKYCVDSQYGTVDNRTTLLAEDDAATVNWGEGWRMPTIAETDELRNGCDWEWTDDFNGSGVAGRIGTSKANGNILFLPAAGFRGGTGLYYAGYFGGYWSSSFYEDLSSSAYDLYFYSDTVDWSGSGRISGLSVRAVVGEK